MAKKFKKLFFEKLETRKSTSPLFAMPRVNSSATISESSGKSFQKPAEGGVNANAISEKTGQYSDKPIDIVIVKYGLPNPEPIAQPLYGVPVPPQPIPIQPLYGVPGPIEPISPLPPPGAHPVYGVPGPIEPISPLPPPGAHPVYGVPGPIEPKPIPITPTPPIVQPLYGVPMPVQPIKPILPGQIRVIDFINRFMERFPVGSMVRNVFERLLQMISNLRPPSIYTAPRPRG